MYQFTNEGETFEGDVIASGTDHRNGHDIVFIRFLDYGGEEIAAVDVDMGDIALAVGINDVAEEAIYVSESAHNEVVNYLMAHDDDARYV